MGRVQFGGAAEDPQIILAFAAYQCIAVVVGKHKDIVVAVEPEEERHLQLAGTFSSGRRALPFDSLNFPSKDFL